MKTLQRTRENDLNSKKSSFISGTNKPLYNINKCGENHSLIREGDEIKIVEGEAPVTYSIDNKPMMLQFTCMEDKHACFEHEDTGATVCISKNGTDIKKNQLFKQANDKYISGVPDMKELHTCFHQTMMDFPDGSATIFHKEPEKCTKLFEEAEEKCIQSGSNLCHKQLKQVTSLKNKCSLVTDNFKDTMAAFPYKTEAKIKEMKKTPEKYESLIKNNIEWAEVTIKPNGDFIAPTGCDTVGAPCGLNHDSYHGQCVLINDNTTPVCRPILTEEDLRNAKRWIVDNPGMESKMKSSCDSEYKEFNICNEFDENKKCIHTISEYTSYNSGKKCDNPYYKTESSFTCKENRHTIDGEVEKYINTNGLKSFMGHDDLMKNCLNKDKGFGVFFYELSDGKSICNVLTEKPTGKPLQMANVNYGSVCLPN